MAIDNDTRSLGDHFAELYCSYEALEALTHSELGGSHPVWVLLVELNGHFRRVLDDLDSQGGLS